MKKVGIVLLTAIVIWSLAGTKAPAQEWSSPVEIAESNLSSYYYSFDIAVEPNGEWHLVYIDVAGTYPNHIYEIVYKNSNSSPVVLVEVQANSYMYIDGASIAMDSSGALHIAYYLKNNLTNHKYVMYMNNVSGFWSSPVEIADVSNIYGWDYPFDIVVEPNGEWHLVYIDIAGNSPNRIWEIVYKNSDSSPVVLVEVPESSYIYIDGASMAMDSSGALHIAYYLKNNLTNHKYVMYMNKAGRPVVLIHGWNGSNDSWGGDAPNLKTLLEDEGRNVIYFTFDSSNWNIPIGTLAARLDSSLIAWSDSLPIDEQGVDIIAHSMGGLIARYFIAHPEFTYADRVKKLVTLGTPHNGAAPAHYSDLLPGTIQGTQMKYGSIFLWNLREDWLATSPETEVLCIAGARNYTDPHDGVVRIPSASLHDLGYPVCYIPNPHSGEAGDLNHIGMAYIKDANHPSYIAIISFLNGTVPPSNENSVNHLTDGMLILGLFDQANNPVGVRTSINPLLCPLGRAPEVWWQPNPHLYCCCPINWGVNDDSYPEPGYGKYFATGADPGDYLLEIHPRGGYRYLFDSPISIYPRQAQIVSLTVDSADESVTESFVEGDTDPFAFGNTGATVDFSSGPGGEVWVHRFNESATATDYTTLPYYWDVISDMADGSFSSTLIFNYDESDLLSAGLIEDELVVAYYDNLWHPIGGEVDPVANTVTVTTSHFTVFSIGDFPTKGSICTWVNLDGAPLLPLQEITVTVLDQNNDPVSTPQQTDELGTVVFDPVEVGEYSVMIMTPLGYFVSPAETQTNVAVVSGECTPVQFLLTPTIVNNDCRTIGYWKHQFNVHTFGHGNAQESCADLETYLNLVHQHFNMLSVYVELENIDFEDAKNVLTVRGGSLMTERAKQQLFALLLNFASGRIGNETVVSDDDQVAAEAVTHAANLINDENPDNDELAKTVCDLINNGQMVGAGIIPESPIRYKFEPESLPQTFSVEQNFPNPFNSQTAIKYVLPEAAYVVIEIYDLLGRHIETVVDARQQAGYHTIIWDGKDQASGMYFYRIQAGEFAETEKMILLK